MCCISPSKDALNLMKQGVLDAAHKRTPAIQMLQKWSCTLIMVLEWPGVVWLKNKHSGGLREVATGPSAYHATCSKFSWRKSTLHISQSHPNPTLRIELTLTCEIPLWVQQCKSTCVVSTGLRLDGKNNSTWLGFSFSLSSSKNKKIHLFPITTGRQSSTTSISMKPRLLVAEWPQTATRGTCLPLDLTLSVLRVWVFLFFFFSWSSTSGSSLQNLTFSALVL